MINTLCKVYNYQHISVCRYIYMLCGWHALNFNTIRIAAGLGPEGVYMLYWIMHLQ